MTLTIERLAQNLSIYGQGAHFFAGGYCPGCLGICCHRVGGGKLGQRAQYLLY